MTSVIKQATGLEKKEVDNEKIKKEDCESAKSEATNENSAQTDNNSLNQKCCSVHVYQHSTKDLENSKVCSEDLNTSTNINIYINPCSKAQASSQKETCEVLKPCHININVHAHPQCEKCTSRSKDEIVDKPKKTDEKVVATEEKKEESSQCPAIKVIDQRTAGRWRATDYR